ncbi:hypothetical protein MferCBS31731_005590 [Microsporum ferrugineum]
MIPKGTVQDEPGSGDDGQPLNGVVGFETVLDLGTFGFDLPFAIGDWEDGGKPKLSLWGSAGDTNARLAVSTNLISPSIGALSHHPRRLGAVSP